MIGFSERRLVAHIAICIPVFNEEANLSRLYNRINATIERIPDHNFSIVFADNCSTDRTLDLIRELVATDPRVGYIKNISNFGFVRSSSNVLLAPNADANIFMMADLQDPPELIPELVYQWSTTTAQVVFAVRSATRENPVLFLFKKIYYKLLAVLSDYPMVRDTTGFGIYDKVVITSLRQSADSYPFIKGLVCAIGFQWSTIPYVSADRTAGKSTASLSFLIDFGILGIVTSSRKPMRMITFAGLTLGLTSFLLSFIVLLTKLVYWQVFPYGLAMLSTSFLFLSGVTMFAIGILGEYIGFINQRTMKLPLVVESLRVNIP